MDKIWGKLKEPTTLSVSVEEDTKASIRQKVWEFMEKNDIANFPRPVYNRIPNYKGSNTAGQKLLELEEFKAAKTVKVNPDKAQEEARYQVMDQDKTLIVPTPRLSKGLFNRLSKEPGMELRKLASREGIDKKSKPVPMASRIKIDLVIVGSVAVDKLGHRIGKGEGFADLEFAMAASHHSAVNSETVIVTTVHDVQIFEELPSKLFEAHDIPVDIIVTPTQVFRVKDRLSRPDHIMWNMLTKEKFDQVPILRELQFKEHKAGKDVNLKDFEYKEANGAPETNGNVNGNAKNGTTKKPYKKKPKTAKPETENGDSAKPKTENGELAKSGPKKEKSAKSKTKKEGSPKSEAKKDGSPKSEAKKDGSAKKEAKKVESSKDDDSKNEKSESKKPAKQYPATVSVFVGKIPRGTRVKELKEVIVAKGVKPLNILWKGGKGYALVYAEKKEIATPEELFEKLKDLKIGDNALNVEPDKRLVKKEPTTTEENQS